MRTAALIDNDLLIDCGPDLIAATQKFGIVLNRVETLLITHAHSDHWLPSNLYWRAPGFCATPVSRLRVFGPGPVTRLLSRDPFWPQLSEQAAISLHGVRAGQSWESGRYRIRAVPATHHGKLTALLYIINDGTHKLLYATDSGPLSEQGWRIVAEEAPFDAVLMDETMGHTQTWGEHHDLATYLEAHQRFAKEAWLTQHARFVAFHFSHQANPPHEELVRYFEPYGVLVAYDGLELTL
jgi:phosphoribosyl 1,2-cyclic phosphodiesterase